jgi:FAD/FMN-containing dehydrogenase
MSAGDLQELGDRLDGDVVGPDDPGWDAARQAWNLSIDQRPAAVAVVAGPDDVAAAVSFARERNLRVAAQGTGHGAGALSPVDDMLLVKTERMQGVEIDTDGARARAEAGVIWRDLLDRAQPDGLTALAGSSPDVGVIGYTLGGGLGWFARKHGLACNSVRAIELVTADGEQRRVDADNDADLFWALRGGGGSFGVVTAIELDLLPVAEVFAGTLLLPAENGHEIMHGYREWTQDVPDEITSTGRFLHLPPLEEIPEPIRDRPLVMLGACYLGSEDDGAELIAPLRALAEPIIDTFATVPSAQLVTVALDPEEPVPATGHHALLRELPEPAVDAFAEAAGPDSGSPLLLAELRHLGGAASTPAADGGALSHLDGAFVFNGVGSLMDPDMADPINRQLDAICDALEPWSNGGCYLNFAERRPELDTLFDADARRRLSEVKSRWDPDGLIHANFEAGAPSASR